jgi:hypothetical protein
LKPALLIAKDNLVHNQNCDFEHRHLCDRKESQDETLKSLDGAICIPGKPPRSSFLLLALLLLLLLLLLLVV